MTTLTTPVHSRLAGDYVLLGGKLVNERTARLSVASSPMLYGLAAYTVLPATFSEEQGKYLVFRATDHLQRLKNSAKIVGMEAHEDLLDDEAFTEGLSKLLQANKIPQDVLVRCTLFTDGLIAGTKLHGLPTNLSMYAYSGPRFHPAEGIDVCVSSWRRTPDNCIPSRAKINGSYVNATLMKNQALLEGYDDAIALDIHDHVAESTVANLFIVRDGVLITPDKSADILEGITRDTVIHWATKQGLSVIERQIDRTELYIADEVFLTGTSARITPVLSIDKRQIGDGSPGKMTLKVQQMYEQLLSGKLTINSDWLSVL